MTVQNGLGIRLLVPSRDRRGKDGKDIEEVSRKAKTKRTRERPYTLFSA